MPVSTVRGQHTGAGRRAIKLKLEHPHLSDAKIAARVGCDPANVHRVLTRFLGAHTEEDLRAFQNNKADIFDAIQLRSLKSITDDDIAKAPLMARVTSAAILEDKARTIRGQASSINVNVLLDAVNAVRELRRRE